MGYLIVKPLIFSVNKEKKCILAVEGWIPEEYKYESSSKEKKFKGIIRQKEKKDYLHHKMKEKDLEKFKMNTYIDMEKIKK